MKRGKHRIMLAIICGLACTSAAPIFAKTKATYLNRIQIGQLDYFNGNVGGAIRNFQWAIKLNPESYDARLSLINVYLQNKEQDKAMEQCYEALKIKPKSRELHMVLAGLLRGKDKLDDAANEIAAADDCGADEAMCAQTLALIRLQQGKLDEAYEQIEKSLDDKPKIADSHLIKAIVVFRKGDKKTALGELDQAIATKKVFSEAHSTKADILAADKNWEEAKAEYAKALRDDPKSIQAELGLANIYFQDPGDGQESNLDKSIEHYMKARDLSSADRIDKNIFYGLAIAYEKKGDTESALAQFQKGLLMENDPIARAQIQMHIQRLKDGSMFNVGAIGKEEKDNTPSFTRRGIYFDLNAQVFAESYANLIKIKRPDSVEESSPN